ncbi:MAG: putative photosynthetic complex assembly protein PuhE [Arenibacterium sp.]
MSNLWIAALFALFLWWFSTGAILMAVRYADRHGSGARKTTTLAGVPVLIFGAFGLWSSLNVETVMASYLAFLSAIAVWGWLELAFLTGAIPGPNLNDCPSDLPEWERFIRAWGTIAYQEMLLMTALVTIWVLGHDALNTFGLWTFTILFFARISAKLNLYFGVPRINLEFVPDALRHLPSHFRISRLNWLFPVSITALSFAVACWMERLYVAATPGAAVGFTLLSAITALALLEHWLMVLPLPDAKLWRWMLPAPKPEHTKTRPEGHHGI